MAWRDSLPELQDQNRRDRAHRASLTAKWDRDAAVKRSARRKAAKVLEESGKLTDDEMGIVLTALI